MKIVDTFVENLFTFWYKGIPKDELAMQPHTTEELIKLEKGRNFLMKENVFDSDGLVDFIEFQL